MDGESLVRSALREIILASFLNTSFSLDVEHVFALGTFYVLDYSSDRSSWITVSAYLILHLAEWPREFAKELLRAMNPSATECVPRKPGSQFTKNSEQEE